MDPNAQPQPPVEQPLVTPPTPSLPPTDPAPLAQAPYSALAIVGFILDFFIAPLGLILSIVALVKIKKNGQRGAGLAIAGIVLGALFIFLFLPILVLTTYAGIQGQAKATEALVTSNQYMAAVEADDGTGAFALETTDLQSQDDADALTTGFSTIHLSGDRSVVSRSYKAGNPATARIVYKYSGGSPNYVLVSLQQNNGQWQVEGFNPTDTLPSAD